MKILVTEKQLQNILKEEVLQNQQDISVAQSLMNDPNNEIIWRCFGSGTESSIFQNGYTSEYFGDGEGSMYGNGVYFFRRPQGALWRVGTGGVGDKIMKCVVLGGFKDFLIFDSRLAKKYYGSDDFTVQLRHFFRDQRIIEDMLEKAKRQCGRSATNMHVIPHQTFTSTIMGDYTAPIAKMFSNTHGYFSEQVKKSKIRGIIYSGTNDVWAGVLFNPREIVPIATTSDRGNNRVVGQTGDLKNWKFLFSEKLLKNIQTHGDTYVIGERLKSFGIINSYEKGSSTENGCLKVMLKNGRPSLFDLKLQEIYVTDQIHPQPQELEKCLVSKHGFDSVHGWVKVNDYDLYEVVQSKRHVYLLKLPTNNKYYYVDVKNASEPYPLCSMDYYDRTGMVEDETSSTILNEEYDAQTNKFYIYHRTDAASKAESIMKLGFSREYLGNNGTSYGDGIYAATTTDDSNMHLRSYGSYMIKGELRGGLKGFIILHNPELAKKIYGTSDIEAQFNLLIPNDVKPLLKQKYGEHFEGLNDKYLLHKNNDIAKTNIRGVVCKGLCPNMIVVSNFKDVIPIEYSTDNGKTWRGRDDNNIERVSNTSDADFDLRRLIANGVVLPCPRGSIYSYMNGYARVILSNRNISYFSKETMTLISKRGFDKVSAPQVNGEYFCEVEVNGKRYIVGYDVSVKKYYLAQRKKIIKKIASVEQLEN